MRSTLASILLAIVGGCTIHNAYTIEQARGGKVVAEYEGSGKFPEIVNHGQYQARLASSDPIVYEVYNPGGIDENWAIILVEQGRTHTTFKARMLGVTQFLPYENSLRELSDTIWRSRIR